MTARFSWAGTLVASLAMTGCAAHNYDFAAAPRGPSRVPQMVGDLDRLAETADEAAKAEDALYDVSLFPLVHSELHVFAEAADEDSPAEFVEAEIAACLPLFAFVNGTVSQYDEQQNLLTRDAFDSSFWGAFRQHRELVVTPAGHRERTRHTVLWLISWCGEETWQPTPEAAREALPESPENPDPV
ncbi:MAG: hypothetical protein AAGD32_15355 [Planctomycetota bacterium]